MVQHHTGALLSSLSKDSLYCSMAIRQLHKAMAKHPEGAVLFLKIACIAQFHASSIWQCCFQHAASFCPVCHSYLALEMEVTWVRVALLINANQLSQSCWEAEVNRGPVFQASLIDSQVRQLQGFKLSLCQSSKFRQQAHGTDSACPFLSSHTPCVLHSVFDEKGFQYSLGLARNRRSIKI